MTFEVIYNDALKIYSQLYVGVKKNAAAQADKPRLAFATPYETTAAGLKRQATVKAWVSNSAYNYTTQKYETEDLDLRIVDNKPLAGFRITDDVKRVYWGGGNVVWRLAHPDGWEIEIQSSNLMALIQAVGIEKDGVIPGRCVIARDGATNVLLPVSSEEYKNAIKAAESVVKPGKIPMKDRIIGRMYRLQDGSFGRYLGKVWVTAEEYDYNCADVILPYAGHSRGSAQTRMSIKEIVSHPKPFEALYIPAYKDKTYDFTHPARVKLYSSASLIEELDQETLTTVEAMKLSEGVDLGWAGSKSGSPVIISRTQNAQVEYVTEAITELELEELCKKAEAKRQKELGPNHKDHGVSLQNIFDIDRHLYYVAGSSENINFYTQGHRCFGNYNTLAEAVATDILSPVILSADRTELVTYSILNNSYYSGQRIENVTAYSATLHKTLDELLAYVKDAWHHSRLVRIIPKEIK